MAAQVNEPEAAVSFIKQAFHGNFNLNGEFSFAWQLEVKNSG